MDKADVDRKVGEIREHGDKMLRIGGIDRALEGHALREIWNQLSCDDRFQVAKALENKDASQEERRSQKVVVEFESSGGIVSNMVVRPSGLGYLMNTEKFPHPFKGCPSLD
jgi:hypothetical protein